MMANGYISCSSHQELNNHVEIKKYVSYIRERYSDEDLDPISLLVLIRFAVNKFTSAYQVYTYLDNDKDEYVIATKQMKNKAHFIAYKNVNEKVQNLYSLGLIEVAKDEDTKHDAIYYRLTPYGIFYLFWKNSILVLVHGREIFKQYKNDKLFQLFLSSMRGSLHQIQSKAIFDDIIDYLNKICNTIIETIDNHISKEKIRLYSWKKLLASNDRNDILLDYLNLGLNLQWLDSETPQIEKRKQENMIKISGKGHSIIIMTDSKDKKKLILKADDERFHEFELRKNGLIIDNRPSASESGLELDCQRLILWANFEIRSLLLSIMGHFATEIDNQYMAHDCISISKDRNLMETFQNLTNNIVKEYNIISKFSGLPTITKKEFSKTEFDIKIDRKSRFYDLLESLTALNS